MSAKKKKPPPDEQALWDDFTLAFHQFEGQPTELNRARVIVRFTAWSMLFSPDTSIADTMVLRARLKVGG